jgi:hypothetical protein
MSIKSTLLGLSGKRSFETISFPPPIGDIEMRTITAAESTEIANFRFDDQGRPIAGREQYLTAKRLSMSIVDPENKNLVFGEEDLEALSTLPETVSDKLLETFWKMNRAEYVEIFAKNALTAG